MDFGSLFSMIQQLSQSTPTGSPTIDTDAANNATKAQNNSKSLWFGDQSPGRGGGSQNAGAQQSGSWEDMIGRAGGIGGAQKAISDPATNQQGDPNTLTASMLAMIQNASGGWS